MRAAQHAPEPSRASTISPCPASVRSATRLRVTVTGSVTSAPPACTCPEGAAQGLDRLRPHALQDALGRAKGGLARYTACTSTPDPGTLTYATSGAGSTRMRRATSGSCTAYTASLGVWSSLRSLTWARCA